VIRALCYQPADGGAAATLWIGTSRGLVGWQPALQLWTFPPDALAAARVHALALDPRDGRLWAGTAAGLYSQHAWRRHADDDVRALAFGPAALWVGTARGLARWDAPTGGGFLAAAPAARLTAATSGLAADEVTALAVRDDGAGWELWVGSPLGVSRLRHPR
jgi:ligand-binding sensor domain-containing protein